MTEEKWRSLLSEANLPIIYDNIQSTKSISELKSHINRFGWFHTSKSTLKSLFWVITKPKHRKLLKSAPKDLGKYLKYGILVAKKPKE
ncbi:MAG: hypothetical protein GF308_16820 [Candidatus Heimdallarchaeota archaeon]|nr:hypothetical protein [Candidatus Heimdallarchaeota archaeon]